MTGSPLVNAIHARLLKAGYKDLSTPFKVANVEFSFTKAMRGSDGRSLDLVLLVDTATGDYGDRQAHRVRQRVEALSRALDVTGSRFVVSVILAGATLTDSIDQLSETCRVLQVEAISLNESGEPENANAALLLDDRIRVLLPLNLPEESPADEAGSGTALQKLLGALPLGTSRAFYDAVTAASETGQEAVTEAAAATIAAAFARHTQDTYSEAA